jgi:hypothetical protein
MSVFNPTDFEPVGVSKEYLQANYTSTTVLNAELNTLLPKAGGTIDHLIVTHALTADTAVVGTELKTNSLQPLDGSDTTAIAYQPGTATFVNVGSADSTVRLANIAFTTGQFDILQKVADSTGTSLSGTAIGNELLSDTFTASSTGGYYTQTPSNFGAPYRQYFVQTFVAWSDKGGVAPTDEIFMQLPKSLHLTIGENYGVVVVSGLTTPITLQGSVDGANYAALLKVNSDGTFTPVVASDLGTTGFATLTMTFAGN